MMKKPKINTMEELAETIGVSRPTLSRYFHDPSSVRASTRDRIARGLDRVDYVPNFFATRLNRRATRLIGVIVPHLNDLFFTSLLDVIEAAAGEADYTIITQSSRGDPQIEAKAVETFLSMSADGVLVAPLGRSSSVDALQRLSARLPIVFVDSKLPEMHPSFDFVGTDNRQSIGIITEYLCRTGAPPVFLGMPRLNSNSNEREAAYHAAMARLGHAPRTVVGAPARESWAFEAYAHDVMDQQFGRGQLTDATILCANDRLAIGVLRAAGRHGLLRCRPERATGLRIAGHDDHPLARFMTPSLTTVAQDIDAIGRAAVGLLCRRIGDGTLAGETAREETFQAVLKIRESA